MRAKMHRIDAQLTPAEQQLQESYRLLDQGTELPSKTTGIDQVALKRRIARERKRESENKKRLLAYMNKGKRHRADPDDVLEKQEEEEAAAAAAAAAKSVDSKAFVLAEDPGPLRLCAEKPMAELLKTKNPHLAQNTAKILRVVPWGEKIPRIIDENFPRKPYVQIPHNQRSVNHWPQRKLLLQQIEFLTEEALVPGREKHLIVCAGYAPGTYLPFLKNLFPEHNFILIDERACVADIEQHLELINEACTTREGEKLRARKDPSIMLSNLRQNVAQPQEQEPTFRSEADLAVQHDFYAALAPDAASLRFGLPWDAGETMYLEGDLYLPVLGGQTTTETRLWVKKNPKMVAYDHTTLEQQMFYFNRVLRVQCYEHPFVDTEIPGALDAQMQPLKFDHCYDCAVEVNILVNYVRKKEKITDEDQVLNRCKELVKDLCELFHDSELRNKKKFIRDAGDGFASYKNLAYGADSQQQYVPPTAGFEIEDQDEGEEVQYNFLETH